MKTYYNNISSNSSGIYGIVCARNFYFYIGSTKKLSSRKAKHIYELRLNKHHSQHLQNAWNLYGEEQFFFIAIENVAIENLQSVEQVYLNANFGKNYFYNSSPISDKRLQISDPDIRKKIWGRNKTEQEKQKISNSKAGKKGIWRDRGESENVKLILQAFRQGKIPESYSPLNEQEMLQCKLAYEKWPRCGVKNSNKTKEYKDQNKAKKHMFKNWLIKNNWFIDNRSCSWNKKSEADKNAALILLSKYRKSQSR